MQIYNILDILAWKASCSKKLDSGGVFRRTQEGQIAKGRGKDPEDTV